MCSVAVVIPCYNEEATIENVIQDYSTYFDLSDIYIINNNSTDKSIDIAKNLGVNIINESIQGKGAAIRRAFIDIDTDYIVITDCDSTYTAEDSYCLYYYAKNNPELEMVVGNRLNSGYFTKHQKINGFGNKLFSNMASKRKHITISDLLSGSRVVSKKLYKYITINYNGFEIETELTLKAINIDYLDINYYARPANSHSSLSIIKDGYKIFKVLFRRNNYVFKEEKPSG